MRLANPLFKILITLISQKNKKIDHDDDILCFYNSININLLCKCLIENDIWFEQVGSVLSNCILIKKTFYLCDVRKNNRNGHCYSSGVTEKQSLYGLWIKSFQGTHIWVISIVNDYRSYI